MILYTSDASPFARLVRILIQHLGLEVEERVVSPFEQDEELRQHNPLGKIPCLLTPLGALYDSALICRYLLAQVGTELDQEQQDWDRAQQAVLVDGLLDSAVALRMEQTREGEGTRSPFWSLRHQDTLHHGLMRLEGQPTALPSGNTLAAWRLLVLLEYLDFRHPKLAWRPLYPALERWWQSQRSPLTEATAPR
ncbi:glutathione S-transferase family protein [Ferrimonas marina]|uniref:Glutathione S-transferase n=1 Tax=Ferrimonas marina TaxID=299255 RepID=A0A1M5VPA8_9GAMM|nr:glutathione S-transferase N-terminal domain-containing protein [Ferrimonas marina]SHH77092.1 glutathione S-transferase [Ferrimonas marina]